MFKRIVAAAVMTSLLLGAVAIAAPRSHGKIRKNSRTGQHDKFNSQSNGPGGLIGRLFYRNKSSRRSANQQPSRVMHAVVNNAEVQAPKNVQQPAPATADESSSDSAEVPVSGSIVVTSAPAAIPPAPAPPADEVPDTVQPPQFQPPIIAASDDEPVAPAINKERVAAMPVLTLTPTPKPVEVDANILPAPPVIEAEQPVELPTSVPETTSELSPNEQQAPQQQDASPRGSTVGEALSAVLDRETQGLSERTSRPRPRAIYIPPRTPNTSRVSGPQYFSASSQRVSNPYPVQPQNDFRAASQAPLRPVPAYPVSYNRSIGVTRTTHAAPAAQQVSRGMYPRTNGAMYPAPQPNIPYQVGGTAITNQAFHPHEMLYAHRYKAMYPPYYYKVNGSWLVTPWGVWSHENWKPMGTTVEVNYRSRISPFAGFKPPVIR